MCWVSSRETSSRSPNIISSSSWAFACGDSSSTGGSRLRGTRGVFLGCFLGVLMSEMGTLLVSDDKKAFCFFLIKKKIIKIVHYI